MENLSFDTGRVTMSINGDASRTISFNPTDPDIVNRFLLLADTCEKKEKEFEKKVEETNRKAMAEQDPLARARMKNDLDQEIDRFFREKVNEIFGEDADKSIFGEVSPTAVTGNGTTVFQNFIQAILPVFEQEIKRRETETNKIIEYYRKKR